MALSRAIIAIAILFISVAARAERRVALVMGNSAYASVGALANPVRDAKAVAEALCAAGFAEVAEGYDLSKPQFDAALKRFGDAASGADWALIYYAGHGIGIGGETYVLPVDAVLARADHAEDEAISLSRLRAKAGGATALRMVILDSCRGNPFAARLAREAGAKRAISRGLPAPALLEGDELIAYATRENDVADDGDGQHSPFTTAFLQHLREPGLEVRFLFGKVRDSVQAATGRAQTPTTYGDLGGAYFYFRAPKPKEETPAPLPPLSEAAEAWRILRDTGSEAELEAFVKRFGDAVFGDFARARLAEVRRTKIAAAKPEVRAYGLSDTHWDCKTSDKQEFNIWFLPDGSLKYQYSSDISYGRWKQEGTKVFLSINEYSQYTGAFVDDATLEGTAKNKIGQTWTWRFSKVKN